MCRMREQNNVENQNARERSTEIGIAYAFWAIERNLSKSMALNVAKNESLVDDRKLCGYV